METFKQIIEHRSIRKYKNTPIAENVMQQICEAALRASSSGNMQTMSIIVTKDEANKKKLYEYHYEQGMILEAPVLLTFCADWNRMIKWCEQRKADPGYNTFHSFMVSVGDAFVAAQNAALAAESMGLGICYMGTTMCNLEKISTLLKCPKYVVPITTLVVGYPDEDIPTRDRLPLTGIVHDETYKDYSLSDIDNIYNKRETEGWDRYMAIPRLKEKVEKASVKNLAQIYTKIKYTREENQSLSKDFFAFLQKQGFM